MISIRRAGDGPIIQTVEAVAFTFPPNAPGQYNFDIAVESQLRGDPMCLVSFDNFTFEILVLGQGLVSPGVVRLNAFYLVPIAAPIPVDLHIMLAAHDYSQAG